MWNIWSMSIDATSTTHSCRACESHPCMNSSCVMRISVDSRILYIIQDHVFLCISRLDRYAETAAFCVAPLWSCAVRRMNWDGKRERTWIQEREGDVESSLCDISWDEYTRGGGVPCFGCSCTIASLPSRPLLFHINKHMTCPLLHTRWICPTTVWHAPVDTKGNPVR